MQLDIITTKDFEKFTRTILKAVSKVQIADVMTKHEVQQLTGWSDSMLEKLRADRKISYYSKTKPFRYDGKSIMAYLEKSKVEAVA